NSGAVENDDFVVARAPWLVTGNDFGQLGVNVAFLNQALSDGVWGVAARTTLFETISDHFGRGDQRRLDFLFVHIVRAHGCNESAGPDVVFAHQKFIRSRAGDTHIALLNCAY